MTVFPTLDYNTIAARYPKGVKKIEEWLFEQEELKNSDFIDKKNPEESKKQFTGMLIQMDPRKLYDIFDALGIVVCVARSEMGEWNYYTNESDIYKAPSRHTAEVSVFHDAFEELENQL